MKKLKIQFVLSCFFTLIFLINTAYSANEMFLSVASGNWNATTTWQMSTNGGANWIPATITPTNLSGVITIAVSNVVTVTADVTADQITLQTGATLSIDPGITLTYPGNASTFTLSGATVSGAGTFKVEGPMTMDLKSSGVFSAGLKIASGTVVASTFTSPLIGKLYGHVTVDAGATLSTPSHGVSDHSLEIYGNLTNNGILTTGTGTISKTMRFKGPSMINNGSVTTVIFVFDSTSNLSGTGSFTPSNDLYMGSNGNVTLLSNMTFAVSDFIFNSGGILNPNGFTVNFTSGGLGLNSGATITNSGLFRTQNNVTFNLRAGSNFNAPLNVSSGITSITDFTSPHIGRLYGPVTVDAGATLSTPFHGVNDYSLEIYGNLINNGTLTTGSGTTSKTMRFKGSSMINNGSVTTAIFVFDSTSNLSGTGSFTPSNDLYMGANGNVTLLSNMTFSVSDFIFNSGGILNPNGFTINFTSGGLGLNSGATITNSGLFRTQNNVTFNLRAGSNFNAPLNVSSGITSITDFTSPHIGRLYGPVTVDAGATLTTPNHGVNDYSLEIYGNLTNNGTLTTGSFTLGKKLIFKGLVFVNDGLVSAQILNLDTNITLSGTGSFITNANILSNRNVGLTTNHQFRSIVINTGATFSIGSNTVKFTASNPIIQNGTFNNAGSKIEYNGTGLQSVSFTNINYYGLRINNPAGASLLGNITVNDTLSVVLGGLNLNARIITLPATGYLTETPGNVIFGVSGYITTTRNVGIPSALNVGGLGAVLTSTTNLGSTEVRRGHTVQTGLNGGTSIKRYFDITPSNNTGLDASLIFKFDDSELNGKPEPSLKLFKSTNSGSSWLYMGGSVNIAANQITLTGLTSFSRWSADSSKVPSAIGMIQEGFYNVATNNLNMTDTVRAYLRNTTNPFAIVDSAKGLLDSLTFKSVMQFSNAATGSYYIQLKHRNSLETWSKNPVNYIQDSTLNYDFTFAATQAFGNNEIQKGTKFCLYSGDVTQDGFIDLTDVLLINNNATNFVTGYVSTDANGNSIVDLTDVLIAYNNSINFVVKKTPLNP